MFVKVSNYNDGIICSNCGNNKTYIRVRNGQGSPVWRNYNNTKVCQNCYNRLVTNKIYDRYSKYQGHQINFYNIRITLSFKLSRDKCDICGITKDKCKKIDRHHYFYCIIMPWSCTIPICNKCHQYITHKGKKYKKRSLI